MQPEDQIDKGSNNGLMNLFVLRKANGLPAKSFDPCTQRSQDGRALRIRVIKVALSSREIKTLLTNLSEKHLPAAEAGELYFKRWDIETAYESKLQLEHIYLSKYL